jgi:2-oxoglutarate/2-oxoacid ferredoxin oxidoreductase subunit alpha
MDFSLTIATLNGSGSLSANQILAKALFRMHLPVSAKNVFPSNIAGLPTWYSIRVSEKGFLGRQLKNDIVLAKNTSTATQDLASVKPGGFFIYDQDIKFAPERSNVTVWSLPLRDLSEKVTDAVKIRKLLANMVYVGVLAKLLGVDRDVLEHVVRDHFRTKSQLIDINLKALDAGFAYVTEQKWSVPFQVHKQSAAAQKKLFIDGNSAAALGALAGGCTFMSWYPITPSTSLAESFQDYCEVTRKTSDKKNNFAIVQAEDELSAINMVIGAGWAGARAMTATSGPGLSLMAEAAGLAYFAEIPAVIWCVQRAGPSTGLPTRTMQGDLETASTLSHGDTEHVVLLPSSPEECFEFAQTAFDIAEEMQTLVIVLSDLALGMNQHISNELSLPHNEYRRGKVLSAEDLNAMDDFARYKDVDGDGIPYRTLPGTLHAKAAYFTRGTGHTEKAIYSEDGENYARLLARLQKKFQLAQSKWPQPVITRTDAPLKEPLGIVCFGSSAEVMPEVQYLLRKRGFDSEILRIRALPLHDDIGQFLESHSQIFIVEQNRDGQMRKKLTQKFSSVAARFSSALSYDGEPLAAEAVAQIILAECTSSVTKPEARVTT